MTAADAGWTPTANSLAVFAYGVTAAGVDLVSYQHAFESTQVLFCFCVTSGVSSVPMATDVQSGYNPFELDQNSDEPQLEQN
jgi:hypothetical protein